MSLWRAFTDSTQATPAQRVVVGVALLVLFVAAGVDWR